MGRKERRMTRLIDKDMLIEILGEMQGLCDTKAALIQNSKIWQQVKDMPTVDAVPVRHGKWLDDGQYDNFFPHHEWRCSECGEHVLEIGVPWFKYCPNCGARMDEE